MKPLLTLADYQRAAQTLGCEVAAIMAVAFVESSGNGFDSAGRIKKRFEPAWFKRLSGKTASTYEQAYTIDKINAMMSTSWGKFQIMGFNHKIAAYATVEAMVAAFDKSEVAQLNGFIGFIKSKKLEDELRTKNWKAFAYTYNGSDYARLGYHTKMAEAYEDFKADPTVVDLKKKEPSTP